jgi:hypothetical protein
VKTSALFPDPEVRAAQLKRVRTISNKARENYEERVIRSQTYQLVPLYLQYASSQCGQGGSGGLGDAFRT